MINTLESSFIGVVPFKILLLRNIGNVGGVGKLFAAEFALKNFLLSSAESRSSKYRGIVEWYFFGLGARGTFACGGSGCGGCWTGRSSGVGGSV
jgi:hypothetical protein